MHGYKEKEMIKKYALDKNVELKVVDSVCNMSSLV